MTLEECIRYIEESNYHKHLYHTTDEANLPSIYEHGILSTKEREDRGIIPCYRGGDKLSFKLDRKKNIEGYVCLSFIYHHPHAYLAKKGGTLQNPVHIKIKPEILRIDGVKFADGVANANRTIIMLIREALNKDLIDLEILYNKQLSELCYPKSRNSRMGSAKKCEILVPNCVPKEMIDGIVGK